MPQPGRPRGVPIASPREAKDEEGTHGEPARIRFGDHQGAKKQQPITPHRPAGFVSAAVVDPFGNVLGVMNNPHHLEVLESSAPA